MRTRIDAGRSGADVTAPLDAAETEPIKVRLAEKIARTMKQQALTQAAAAALIGATQPDVSKMLRGDFRQFSVERLLRFLVALGHPVEISVRPIRRDKPVHLTLL
jgi:predicted XRE-type DNA-binding protein